MYRRSNRQTLTISLDLLDDDGHIQVTYGNVTPDPGAEVSVGGLGFLAAINLSKSIGCRSQPAPVRAVQSKEVDPSFSSILNRIEIPSNPSVEQIASIKGSIMQHFNLVFEQSSSLKCMKGPEMVIHLKEGAIPYYMSGTRPVAYADRVNVKDKLETLLVLLVTWRPVHGLL